LEMISGRAAAGSFKLDTPRDQAGRFEPAVQRQAATLSKTDFYLATDSACKPSSYACNASLTASLEKPI
jgi:hypothetical protein